MIRDIFNSSVADKNWQIVNIWNCANYFYVAPGGCCNTWFVGNNVKEAYSLL